MPLETIQTIGVVGAGTMGLGIAQVCAQAGYKTILFDINAKILQKAETKIGENLDKSISLGKLPAADKETILNNIVFTDDTLQLITDIVIEAVVERLEVKQSILRELATINSASTIFATNTSSLSVTQIAAVVPHPERVAGMHFFNPAHIMKLVEVVAGAATDPAITETLRQLALKLGKTPVVVQDSPGFIVNRVARHYYVESLKLLEEGVADVETIDQLMRASGFRLGPFELIDMIGVDVNYAVTASLFEAFHQDPKFRPSRIQQQKVHAGHLGRKSGKGFYTHE